MRSVSVRLEDLKTMVLNLGFAGENEHTRVTVDCKKMYDQYPSASASLTVQPPEGEAYPAVIERDGDNVIWDVTDSDLIAEGSGELQLSFTQEPHLAKSYTGRFKVGRSLLPTGSAPEGIDDFLTRAGAALTGIPETINSALAEAKASGEFDGPQGPAGQDGAPGQDGVDGVTPEISIGTVAKGTDPAASMDNTDPAHPVLSLTLPKGDKGDTGDAAPAEQVVPAVNAYLASVITNPDSPPLDRDLASSSAAAPADMVGDLKREHNNIVAKEVFKVGNSLTAAATANGYKIKDGGVQSDQTRTLKSFAISTTPIYVKTQDGFQYRSGTGSATTIKTYLGAFEGYVFPYTGANYVAISYETASASSYGAWSAESNIARVESKEETIFESIVDGKEYYKEIKGNSASSVLSKDIQMALVPGDYVVVNFYSMTGATWSNLEFYVFDADNNYTKLVNATAVGSYLVKIEGTYVKVRVRVAVTSPSTPKLVYGIYKADPMTLAGGLSFARGKINNLETGYKNRTNRRTLSIFRKVVCCGDSYTSGYITDSGGTAHGTNEDYAFPHYLSLLTGNTYVNCGQSGANAHTWLTGDRGLAKAQASGKAQAYILGLMINDSSSDQERNLTLGTSDDIGTETISFYGCYSKIIRELLTISPDAILFIETCPKIEGSRFVPYNQAVHDIYEAYKPTYANLHLLDLFAKYDMFTNESLTGDSVSGHYTALGYEQFAEILAEIISDYINEHPSDFQDVAFIPYE